LFSGFTAKKKGRMRVEKKSLLLIKFAPRPNETAFCEYRVSRGRSWQKIVSYFREKPGFRFGVLFERTETGRGPERGFFSQKKDEFYWLEKRENSYV
jgi:hypothetical protein